MIICERWDIILVPFPFVDLPVAKVRPALVFSTSKFNEANDHSILMMITSAKRSVWPSDIIISDLTNAGLPTESLLRWKVFTLPNTKILRRIGRLAEIDHSRVKAAQIQHLLG